MSLTCSCLNINSSDKYNGHTTVCILRLCQTVISLSKNRERDSTICITKTKPLLMFLTECLKNASDNNNIVRQIVDVLICHELWILNDDDIIQLLLNGTDIILMQSNRWNDISPSIFIDFCVSKVKADIDVPTMGLLQLLLEHDVTKDVILRQYVSDILPKIILKLVDETMDTRHSTSEREQLQRKIFSILRNIFKHEESATGCVPLSENERNKKLPILSHHWKDFMSSSILLLDSTKSVLLKGDILDCLRELCSLDIFVIDSSYIRLKDEPLILELLCVCKRKIREKSMQFKVMAVLIDLMKTYTKLTTSRHFRKIGSIPDCILRSDIVPFVRDAMITDDMELFRAMLEFFNLLTSNSIFPSNRKMLDILECSLSVVFMICRNKSYDPQLFVRFAINVLKQHHTNQDFIMKNNLPLKPTLQIQQQVIKVFSKAFTHTNITFLLQYAKLLSFCSSVEVHESLWGLYVDCVKKLSESTTRSLIFFKITLIIADALMKWNRFLTVFGVHSYFKDLPDRSVEMNVIKKLNASKILPYVLGFVEVANPLDDVEDSVYIEVMMKLLKLSIKLCEFKICDKKNNPTCSVTVHLNEDKGQSVEVVVPSTVLNENAVSDADCWTADTVMSILELLQSKGRLCNEWFKIMAFVVVAIVKAQMPWYDVEKELPFYYGWKLFDAVKGLCEYIPHDKKDKIRRDDAINDIVELTRGKTIACGMAELAVIYVTEMLSPKFCHELLLFAKIRTRRNRDYFTSNLKTKNGFISSVLHGNIHKDYILFFWKTYLYIIANWHPKDKALNYFPNITTNFSEIISTLQNCDVEKIVTFEPSFFRFLIQNTISEFTMANLIESWMKQDRAATADFLKEFSWDIEQCTELSCDVEQSLSFSEMLESCMMHLITSGEPDCSNLTFGILSSKRKLYNWKNLWNIFSGLIKKIVDEDERLAFSENSSDIVGAHHYRYLVNFSNTMKLITLNARNRNVPIVTTQFCEDLMKITMKYYRHHNIGALGLDVLNLCKYEADLYLFTLTNPKFMQFLEKRLNFRKGTSTEISLAFDIAAYIVDCSTENHSRSRHSEDIRTFQDAAKPKTISWKLSSVLPQLVNCRSTWSVTAIKFISVLLKRNLKSSFVTVEELTSKEPQELSDILTNIYLYIQDVLQRTQNPDDEDSLWRAVYLILHYAWQIASNGEAAKSVIETTERKIFLWNLIGEHAWSRLSIIQKLVQLDAKDLSHWSENFLQFIKQWLQGHHMMLKDDKKKQEYLAECEQDLSFVKIVVDLFKKFRMYENNATWPARREKVEEIYRNKVFLAHYVFLYCVIILKEFFAQIPKGSFCWLYYKHYQQAMLSFIQNVDLEYYSKIVQC